MNTGGQVIWITGLSGAGKTTLARALHNNLQGSILLDGDDMREALAFVMKGYDVQSRKNLAMTYARLANMLARQGALVIVATISLFHDVQNWNRVHSPNYLEVFLDVSSAVREARDPKGLYARAKRGEAREIAGKSVQVEFPVHPDIVLTEKDSIESSMNAVMNRLNPAPCVHSGKRD